MKIFLFVILFLPFLAKSQDFFNFLKPESPSTTLEVEGLYMPTSKLEKGHDKSQVQSHGLMLNQKVFDNQVNLVTVGARYQKLDLTSSSPLLNDFYNQQANLSLRHRLKDDKFWFSSLSYGSASDRPFKDSRDNTLTINYIQKVNSKWFIAANYSNNRTFLNNIPLPGFIYVKEMSREKSLVIGFPFVFILTPLAEHWSLRYLGFIPWTHRLRFLYTKAPFIKPYIGFEQAPQNYFRAGREDADDRFFWFERKIVTGIEGGLNRSLKFDLGGGLAFDRQFFEARNFSQSKDFLINAENAYFVTFNFRYNL